MRRSYQPCGIALMSLRKWKRVSLKFLFASATPKTVHGSNGARYRDEKDHQDDRCIGHDVGSPYCFRHKRSQTGERK
jgi:hypothetical protein